MEITIGSMKSESSSNLHTQIPVLAEKLGPHGLKPTPRVQPDFVPLLGLNPQSPAGKTVATGKAALSSLKSNSLRWDRTLFGCT